MIARKKPVPAGDTDFTVRDLEVMSEATRYNAWIFDDLIRPNLGRRVLEIGSGIGNYSTQILAESAVDELTCLDLDSEHIRLCRESVGRASNKRVDYIVDDFVDVDWPSNTFDTVLCINVLEHIQQDQVAIAKAAAALVPGGRFVIYVPAFPQIMGGIDVRLGHHRRYDKKGLVRQLETAGFNIRTAHYCNMLGFFGWLVRFRLLGRDEQSAGVVGIFDRLVFPFQSKLEALLPSVPFGQNLYVTALKTSSTA